MSCVTRGRPAVAASVTLRARGKVLLALYRRRCGVVRRAMSSALLQRQGEPSRARVRARLWQLTQRPKQCRARLGSHFLLVCMCACQCFCSLTPLLGRVVCCGVHGCGSALESPGGPCPCPWLTGHATSGRSERAGRNIKPNRTQNAPAIERHISSAPNFAPIGPHIWKTPPSRKHAVFYASCTTIMALACER